MGLLRKALFLSTPVPLTRWRSKKETTAKNTKNAVELLRDIRDRTRPEPEPAPPAPTPQGPPPGWYTDPQGQAPQRWWDGTAWTEHITG